MRSAMSDSLVIENAVVADGVRDSSYVGNVVVSDGKIVDAGEDAAVPPGSRVVDGRGLYVVPGLMDAHCHLIYNDVRTMYDLDVAKSIPEATIDAVSNARLLLDQGFTTIRDLGSRANIGVHIREAVARGAVAGPRVLAAGKIISTVGGLLDGHPSHLFAERPYRDGHGEFVTGPWEARSAVRQQFKDGVDWIKTETSGTGFNPYCGEHTNTLSSEELSAIVDEARTKNLRVAVHAESREGITKAARAGVDTIEHGIFMDAEGLELLLEHDIALSPTLALYVGVAEWGTEAGLPHDFVESQKRSADTHVANVRRAFEASATIIVGADGGLPGFPQGSGLREAQAYVDLIGMTPMQAVKAMTSSPARVFGFDGELGVLVPGAAADMVVLNADPLSDIAVFQDAAARVAVLQAGMVVAGQLPMHEKVA
jgi:imidazolonepropionase-like amidohydrolase